MSCYVVECLIAHHVLRYAGICHDVAVERLIAHHVLLYTGICRVLVVESIFAHHVLGYAGICHVLYWNVLLHTMYCDIQISVMM